jgi:hypothetical protein
MNHSILVKEIIQFIDSTIETLKSKSWEIKTYLEYLRFKNGLWDISHPLIVDKGFRLRDITPLSIWPYNEENGKLCSLQNARNLPRTINSTPSGFKI